MLVPLIFAYRSSTKMQKFTSSRYPETQLMESEEGHEKKLMLNQVHHKKISETMDVTCCFLEIYKTLTSYLQYDNILVIYET